MMLNIFGSNFFNLYLINFLIIQKKIESTIEEENITWSEMIEDYNFIDNYKSDLNAKLDEIENTWSNQYQCYKPFSSTIPTETAGIETEFQELHLQQEEKQLADQYPF